MCVMKIHDNVTPLLVSNAISLLEHSLEQFVQVKKFEKTEKKIGQNFGLNYVSIIKY